MGYYVFEGPDGSGKTTTIDAVRRTLIANGLCENQIVVTRQPGSTPLGAHIRQLVKYPHTVNQEIRIDDLSRQLLYMVDCINDIKTIVQPALDANKIVLSDRVSYITSYVYAMVEKIPIENILAILNIFQPPMITKLFILNITAQQAKNRTSNRYESVGDHYDAKGLDFHNNTNSIYSNIIDHQVLHRFVDPKNVVYIDAEDTRDNIVSKVLSEIY